MTVKLQKQDPDIMCKLAKYLRLCLIILLRSQAGNLQPWGRDTSQTKEPE